MKNQLLRALIKRVELLPNVSEFATTKFGYHEYAALFGLEKVMRTIRVWKLSKVNERANKYLIWQCTRLSKYVISGQTDKAEYLIRILITKSNVYRLLALNRVFPKWFLERPRSQKALWFSLSRICKDFATGLQYDRVWIDKKPGDFARPLGVPRMRWRIYGFMLTDILERVVKAKGLLEDFQHGGRSQKGVKSCWESLIPRLKTNRYIYEFDLKGFFDNVRQDKIVEILKTVSPMMADKFSWIMKAKPIGYTLPPEPNWSERTRGIIFRDEYNLVTPIFGDQFWYAVHRIDPQTVNSANWKEIIAETKAIRPEFTNPVIINDKMYIRHATRRMPDSIFGPARDSIKGLRQVNKGVPQGFSTSPLLSTLLTDHYLGELGRTGMLIMYMDDGLLLGNSRKGIEMALKILEHQCKQFGVDLAPDKSGWVKFDGTWIKSNRFLGLRYDYVKDTLVSETRAGTRLEFPALLNPRTDMAEMAKKLGIGLSGLRRKYDQVVNTTAYEAGLKYGFLGCMIAESWSKDSKTMNERKLDILLGIDKANQSLYKSNDTFIWKHQDLHEVPIHLTNSSSLAVNAFLRKYGRSGQRVRTRIS